MLTARADPAHLAPSGPHPATLALEILFEAYDLAQEVERDVWELAIGVRALRVAGVGDSWLRWLLCKGYAEQAVERSRPGDGARTFRRVANLGLFNRSCFVLTEAGVAYVRALCGDGAEPPSTNGEEQARPCWDGGRRELRLEGVVVKRFKQPAPNQEKVLAAFEEEGWPNASTTRSRQCSGRTGKLACRRRSATSTDARRTHSSTFKAEAMGRVWPGNRGSRAQGARAGRG
jgi:hypothetical protein